MTADAATDRTGTRKERTRKPKEHRREQLIQATIESIATRGYAATTLADVADGAGLSRGIVNFHFESKDRLLLETLQFMSDDYSAHWREALAQAGSCPAARLRALVVADLDEAVCNPRMISAWFGFWAEAASNPAYQDLCWAHDDDYLAAMRDLCAALKVEAGYDIDASRIATAVYALQEGLWLRLMLTDDSFPPAEALTVALDSLGNLFPAHFDKNGEIRQTTGRPE